MLIARSHQARRAAGARAAAAVNHRVPPPGYGLSGGAAPAMGPAAAPRRAAPSALPRAAIAVPARRRLLLAVAVILSVTVLQRFAVPVAGSVFGLGFLLCLAATLVGLMQGVLQIDPRRAALYGFAICALLSTLLVKRDGFSLLSLAMLMTLYAPFVAVLTVRRDEYVGLLHVFQRGLAFVAWCGLIQFAVQFFLSPAWMFPFDRVLPEALFIPGFNLVIPFHGGYLKSTGFWLLEPSIFSQLLAFALLIELAYFRRLDRMVLYGCAYLTSFSGTGAMLVFAMAPLVLLRTRSALWILLSLVVFASMLLLRELPMLSLFFERAVEFANARSSGSMRMIAPYWAVGDLLLADPRALLFGLGPGQWGWGFGELDYSVLDSGWLKLLFEYGLIGAIPFLVFYLYCLFAASPDRLLSLACLLQFAFLGGYLNAYYVGFLHMILVVWPRLPVATSRRGASASAAGPHEASLAAQTVGRISS
jgi:hypothetical protein